MGLKPSDIIITLVLNLLHCAQSDHILPCNGTSLDDCPGDHQQCNITALQCQCEESYVLFGENCVIPPIPDEPVTGHSVTAVIITIFTIVLIVSGLILVIRKYDLIELARQKINLRRNNDVMYEDVMIGNDDPPLSP